VRQERCEVKVVEEKRCEVNFANRRNNNNHEDTTMTTKNTNTTTTPRARGISVKLQATTYQHVLAVKRDIEDEMGIHLSLTQALAVIVLRYRILDPKTPNLI